MARVLVTGATGQIGSFLVERLAAGGHTVIGVSRSMPVWQGLANVQMHVAALDADGVTGLLDRCGALDAIVHLAGQTSVAASWRAPMASFDANARTAAALAYAAQTRQIRLVHASSAEIFGHAAGPLLDESTPIAPVSPYGVAKAAAHAVVRLTRDGLGAAASNLIFFLGESPRRGADFVFRKITRGLARVMLGRASHVALGNTAAVRDFCHADDFARAAELLALGGPPGDYVCASGEAHAVAEIATACCAHLGLDPATAVRTDPALFRAADIPRLVGDAAKLRALGWAPTLDFRALVATITDHDLAEARGEDRP